MIIIKLLIDFKCSRLPQSHQMLFVSVIKECFKFSNEDLFNELYNTELKIMKRFTFAVKVQNYILENDTFLDSERVTLTITSNDKALLIALYNGFIQKHSYIYKDYSLIISNVKILNLREIKSNVAIFDTLSPIYISKKDKKPICIGEDGFEKEFNYACDLVLKECRGYGLQQPIEFKDISMKSVMVKISHRTFETPFLAKSSQGKFALIGHIQDLNDIYSLGIGMRRSEGFGCLNLIG